MPPKYKKRADGRYQGKLLVGVTDGKSQYRYVYGKSDKEVKDKLAELRVELGRGVDLTQERTLSWWIDRWLRRAEKKQSEDWYALCEHRAGFWKERLGRADVTRLTAADIEDVLLDLAERNPRTGRPTARKTLAEYRSVLDRVYDFILQNRVVTFNPVRHVEIKKDAARKTRDAITDDQIALIRNTPHEAQLPCLLMLYCGLRLGELAALTWSDVDLENKTLTVNKSLNFKQRELKAPKTAAGVRTVPIPDLLLPFLQASPRSALLVFPHKGAPYTPSSWNHALDNYLRALGFTTTAHCLRHTYCTLLYEAGVDVLSAKDLMGHADVTTTMKIYTHLRDQKKITAAAKLNAYLSGAAAPQTAENA